MPELLCSPFWQVCNYSVCLVMLSSTLTERYSLTPFTSGNIFGASWLIKIFPAVKAGHRHAALLFEEVKGLIERSIQHIFIRLYLDKSHPWPFHHLTSSPPLIPIYMSLWVYLLKCWKGHRNMPRLGICTLWEAGFEFYMHHWVISFVAFLWVIRNKIQRDSIWPSFLVTTFCFSWQCLFIFSGVLIHC